MKKIVRFIATMIKLGMICVLVMMTAVIASAAYTTYGGLWGLFLALCTGALVVAGVATAVCAIVSVEEWLEEDE